MKEIPILYSDPMALAILKDRKTETRRVVKPQPPRDCHYAMNGAGDKALCMANPDADVPEHPWYVPPRATSADTFLRCPYGVPGDRHWVREAWGLLDTEPKDGPDNATVFYRATDGDRHDLRHQRWRPSIHMPRWASRLMLEVTGVRVERLQAITAFGVKAEGIDGWVDVGDGTRDFLPRESFRALWESINGKRPGCSWKDDPFVWVVQFKRVEV